MLQTRTGPSRSRLISAMLAGAWRQQRHAPVVSPEELEIIAPLLIGSGGGALAFWKLRGTDLEKTSAAEDLKQAYRLYTLQAAIHEREIQQVLKLLAQAGVDPILVKGWAIARHYPEQALRPYGDIDLFIRPEQFRTAQEILSGSEGRNVFVDLHEGASHLDDQPLDDLFARSTTVDLGDVTVRVLSPEDHLRILCVHFLHHGAWRPAALCDIGLLVEQYQGKFDWKVCLTNNQRRSKWVTCTVALAHELLDADISGTPIGPLLKNVPRWFIPAVLREWENPVSVEHVVPPPLAERLSHPIKTVRAIRRRWPPNPIQATIVMNGPFNDWPRFIFQAGNYFSRTAKFLANLPGESKLRDKQNRPGD